jgi:hypothetical protein
MPFMPEEEYQHLEYVKTVTISDGRQIEIRVPIMKHLLPALAVNTPLIVALICAATNMTMAEYEQLNYVDGLNLMQPVNSFLEAIQAYSKHVDRK